MILLKMKVEKSGKVRSLERVYHALIGLSPTRAKGGNAFPSQSNKYVLGASSIKICSST